MQETGYKIRDQHAIHFITLTIVYWIDVLSRRNIRDLLAENLAYCQAEKDIIVYACVIMTNHMHLMIQSKTGQLSNAIRDYKGYTSKKMIEYMHEYPESRRKWMMYMFRQAAKKHSRNSTYQVWTHSNHPIEVESNSFLDQKLHYIHQNPVRAGFVENPEDYLYSSARNYAGLESCFNITLIE